MVAAVASTWLELTEQGGVADLESVVAIRSLSAGRRGLHANLRQAATRLNRSAGGVGITVIAHILGHTSPTSVRSLGALLTVQIRTVRSQRAVDAVHDRTGHRDGALLLIQAGIG